MARWWCKCTEKHSCHQRLWMLIAPPNAETHIHAKHFMCAFPGWTGARSTQLMKGLCALAIRWPPSFCLEAAEKWKQTPAKDTWWGIQPGFGSAAVGLWPDNSSFSSNRNAAAICSAFSTSVIVILAYHSFRASDLSFQRRYGSFQKRYGICKKSSCYRVNKISGAQICHVHDQQEEQQVAHGEAHFT